MERRRAMQAAAAMFAVPATAANVRPLPSAKLLEKDADAYWKRIRDEQFYLPGWRAFLNNGSLGIVSRPVLQAVSGFLASAAALEMDWYPRWGYETLDEYRQEFADFFGCKKDELAFTHNATEAMSTIAAGIDLKAGDEVLLTDQEHPSGRGPWLTRQARHGITVREVKIPLPPKSPEQLTDLLISAIGPRTRVLSFSGIMSPTGLLMPVREICTAARAKGVITVVDAAHMHGQVPVNLSEFNCDYSAGSPHKWVFAPAGCGLLYIREENLDRLWPTIISGGWDKKDLKAARFMNVGTNNRAIFEGMMAGLRFLKELGPDRVYNRIHELARYARTKAAASPHLELLTPEHDRMYGSLLGIRFKTSELQKLSEQLKKRRIWIAPAQQVRLSAHIHTRKQDIDLYFELIRETLG